MINDYYSNNAIIKIIKNKIASEDVVELRDFLKPKIAKKLFKNMEKLKFLREEKLMSHSYGYSTNSSVLKIVINEIIPFILDITTIKDMDLSIVKITHKDYILLHEDKHKLFILELTNEWDDTYGGRITFSDGSGTTKNITTRFNSFILSNGKLRFFIKYSHNKSKNKHKYMIIGRFK